MASYLHLKQQGATIKSIEQWLCFLHNKTGIGESYPHGNGSYWGKFFFHEKRRGLKVLIKIIISHGLIKNIISHRLVMQITL